MIRRRGPPPIEWTREEAYVAAVRRADAGLIVMIAPSPDGRLWTVTALESPAHVMASMPTHMARPSAAEVRAAQTMIFDNHAHEVLEPQRTALAARRLGERYMRWWQGSRATHFSCACKAIARPKKKSA